MALGKDHIGYFVDKIHRPPLWAVHGELYNWLFVALGKDHIGYFVDKLQRPPLWEVHGEL